MCSPIETLPLLSTPSLGITLLPAPVPRGPLPEAFNSLSRDHEAEGGPDFHEREAETSGGFQLPLSGSPSPIPGFSGSLRLSAAAPLRTNDS
jgi:hypothetical protein